MARIVLFVFMVILVGCSTAQRKGSSSDRLIMDSNKQLGRDIIDNPENYGELGVLLGKLATQEDKDLLLRAKPKLIELAEEKNICSNPVVGNVKLGSDFKYGCFCGENYPELDPIDLNGRIEVDLMELAGLHAARYFKVRPIDDIDRACRNHDVCWTLNGDGNGQCNKELVDSLKILVKGFADSHAFGDTDNESFRCQIMARDMGLVFTTLFVEHWEYDKNKQTARNLSNVLTLPLTAFYVALRGPVWLANPYPLSSDRCNVQITPIE